MSYCTETEVRRVTNTNIIDQLADDAASGSPVTAIITQAITDADEIIYGYIKGQYENTTPSASSIPTSLRNMAARLAAYLLGKRQGIDDQSEYSRIVVWLGEVANGNIAIDAEPTRLPESTSRGRAKTFSDRSLEGYGLDYPSGGSEANEMIDQ